MRRSHVLAAAAVALTVLSACGSSADEAAGGTNAKSGADGNGGKVATLQSAAPKASAKKAERPRERLDTTPEEYEQMLEPYYKCMEEQGAGTKRPGNEASSDEPGPAARARVMSKGESAKYDQANRVCEPQFMPLPPWERDPANPEARDFAFAVVKCLKGKGVKFVEVDADGLSIALGGDQNHSKSITDGLEFMGDCERQVAKQMKD